MVQAGRELSADERAEYQKYANLGLTQPDKFANVVQENTDVRGMVYRFATADEQKAADDAVKAAADAAQADADLEKKVRAEAAKRNQQVVVPAKPQAPENG